MNAIGDSVTAMFWPVVTVPLNIRSVLSSAGPAETLHSKVAQAHTWASDVVSTKSPTPIRTNVGPCHSSRVTVR